RRTKHSGFGDRSNGRCGLHETPLSKVEIGELTVRISVARLAHPRGLKERALTLFKAKEAARCLGKIRQVHKERHRSAPTTRLDRFFARFITPLILTGLKFDRTQRVKRDLLELWVVLIERRLNRSPRLIELAKLHQRPCGLGAAIDSVERLQLLHAVEPLLMLPKRIVRPRELVENLGVPADRVRIVDWMPRLVETSRLPSVPERLRKVRLSVIMDLRHREMRHIRIRIFFEQRLRRFACVDVSTRKDK